MTENTRELAIVSLYPKDMNIYGDTGNVKTIALRARLYGYEPRIYKYNVGDAWPEHVDLVLGGGGQDKGQAAISDDLFARSQKIHELAQAGVPMLLICGLYQLFGEYFETNEGVRLPGINVLGVHTVGQDTRMIGNLVEHNAQCGTIVGYENHSGQTFVHDDGTEPWAEVKADGTGNNGVDHTEGARKYNVIGTYMHGSVLPKNPQLADLLIRKAAEHRYGNFEPISTVEQAEELNRLNAMAKAAAQVAASRPR
ncbi:glutamine amidotransferase [Alloscardovia theropitheci]|uniref:Lipid II isoglutaminyl synthase (glutamine-hydrolyzing) subunit GatD n=1 Tax=Alloscardovia theropitheci TaxID=2496842 RepID=A0A4R0QPR1_9BIFI|nr:glutamine amidotransferase [Alloscardovia theropitheci]TCD54242.1 glutamine amidotransferase [Alloscardovia theropitheci]